PTVSVTSQASATAGHSMGLSSLVAVNDRGSVGYQMLELWDSDGTTAGGQFFVNGVAQTGGHQINVAPGAVAGATFHVGTSPGTDTLWARLLEDGGALTAWEEFTVTVAA